MEVALFSNQTPVVLFSFAITPEISPSDHTVEVTFFAYAVLPYYLFS